MKLAAHYCGLRHVWGEFAFELLSPFCTFVLSKIIF